MHPLSMRTLPEYQPQWTVRKGMEQLRDAFQEDGLTREELLGDRYFRIKRLRSLQAQGLLNDSLRWTATDKMALAEAGA